MASTIRHMSKSLPPSRTAPQFVVRFPDEDMRDRIKQAAEANNRSMNAEIIARLQESFAASGPKGLFGIPREEIEKIVEDASKAAADEAYRRALAAGLLRISDSKK